jgi:hypothetical protein
MRTTCLGFYRDQTTGSVLIGVRIYEGARHISVQTGSGTHPAHYSMHTGVLSREVHQTGRDIDQSSPSRAEVKTEWSCTSVPPHHVVDAVFHVICLHLFHPLFLFFVYVFSQFEFILF